MPRCNGTIDGSPCCFGIPPGTKKRTLSERCLFCDIHGLEEALLTRLSRARLVKSFKKLQEHYQKKVINRLPSDVANAFAEFVKEKRYCIGREEEICRFALKKKPSPFELTKRDVQQCLFCAPTATLKAFLEMPQGITRIQNMLKKMSPSIQEEVVSSRIPDEYDQCECVLEQ